MPERSLAAYLPVDRIHSLVGGVDLPERSSGATLFADIVGFTTLSGDLTSAHGARRGVDLLSQILEAAYEEVVATIHERAGSVIGFSGDAVMCWFDDQPIGLGELPSGAARAVACGLELHERIARLTPIEVGGSAAPLALKVAIASGPATRHLVGDPDQRVVEVLGGATVTRVGDLERQAFLGQVIVDTATLEQVPGAVTAAAAGLDIGAALLETAPPVDPTPWPPVVGEPSDDIAAPWVDRRLRERVEAGLTELRPATALFLRFACMDFDGDPVASGEELDRFVRWVQATVEPTDGHLLQVTVGDKSSYLYVTFGAPHTHEDLAARAATSTLALRDLPAELSGLGPVQIGLAQGVCRVGAYGARACMTYGALGDGTNLAARLMMSCEPGHILATADVAESAGPGYVTSDHDPVQAKGFLRPVDVVEIEGKVGFVAPRAAHRRHLSGRDEELAWLVGRLERVTAGPAGTTTVRGEAGIGKSHLLAEAKRRLLATADVTWIDCQAEERVETALGPFLGLLRDVRTYQELATSPDDRTALFNVAIDALVEEVRAGDDAQAHEQAVALSAERSYLGALIGLQWPGSPYERHDRSSRFERCLRTFERLVTVECCRRPLVIHVSDGHWIDPESHRLIERLARLGDEVPLAVVIDERPSDAAPIGEVLELGPLDPSDVSTLVAALLDGPAHADLVEAVASRSQHNPFFAEQLVLGLVDADRIRLDRDGLWELADGDATDLPVSLSAVLVARLDRLPEAASTLVQQGAVLGFDVQLDLLEAVHAAGQHETGQQAAFDDVLATALDAGIWFREGEGSEQVEFHHALLRDAAYQVQPEARLRERHRQAAAAIATLHPEDERSADLAHHHERAGNLPAVFGHLRVAARLAHQLPAHREARTHLLRARAIASEAGVDDIELLSLHRQLGEIRIAMGEYQEAVDQLGTAVGLATAARDRTELLHLTGEALERWGRSAEAETAYEQAIEALQEDPDGGLAGRLYAGLAMVHCAHGDLGAAAELAELALVFAQADEDDAEPLARAHHNLCVVELRRGDLVSAKHHGELSLAAADRLDRPDALATAHNDLGLLALATGDVEGAVSRFELAVELFDAAGNDHGLARALGNLADGLREAGREEASFACLERAVAILAQIGMGDNDVFSDMWRSGTW